jgi:probable selenium-dependent hydroxylase accessory protein YqeC
MKKGHGRHGLKEALELKDREVISLVGGGGKTSLMFLLAEELRSSGYRVITTTTTKILEPGPDDTPFLSVGDTQETIFAHLDLHGHVTMVSPRLANRKLLNGIPPAEVDVFQRTGRIDFLIVEADGAARKPLKAPESYEPVIPASTSLVVGLLGADAFDAVLSEDTVFRSDIFSRLTGLPLGARITSKAISSAFTHREGIIKGTPQSARVILFVNKVELDDGLQKGREFARVILDSAGQRIERVVLGHLLSEPVIEDIIST